MKGTIVDSDFLLLRSCDVIGAKLFPFVHSVETDETLDLGGIYVPCIYSHAR